MNFIRKIPMPVSGVALAVASLGNLLLSPFGEVARLICGIISALLLCMFLLKIIFDFKNVNEDLKNPVFLSVLPTSTMAVMVLCTYLKSHFNILALGLWYIALAVHIFIMLLFAKRFILGFELKNVFPTWFVACVGIVVASVTSADMGTTHIGQVIFFIGFAFYIIVFPIVTYRIAKLEMPEPARPTIAIFTAPMNLSLAGYFSAFDTHNITLVLVMLIIAIVLYVATSVKVVFLLPTKFFPSFAAFTFPYVISATAFSMANDFLFEQGISFFEFVPVVSKWIAIVMVIFVLIRYGMFFFSILRSKPAQT
jgi:exfoliative toxin A/B